MLDFDLKVYMQVVQLCGKVDIEKDTEGFFKTLVQAVGHLAAQLASADSDRTRLAALSASISLVQLL